MFKSSLRLRRGGAVTVLSILLPVYEANAGGTTGIERLSFTEAGGRVFEALRLQMAGSSSEMSRRHLSLHMPGGRMPAKLHWALAVRLRPAVPPNGFAKEFSCASAE